LRRVLPGETPEAAGGGGGRDEPSGEPGDEQPAPWAEGAHGDVAGPAEARERDDQQPDLERVQDAVGAGLAVGQQGEHDEGDDEESKGVLDLGVSDDLPGQPVDRSFRGEQYRHDHGEADRELRVGTHQGAEEEGRQRGGLGRDAAIRVRGPGVPGD